MGKSAYSGNAKSFTRAIFSSQLYESFHFITFTKIYYNMNLLIITKYSKIGEPSLLLFFFGCTNEKAKLPFFTGV